MIINFAAKFGPLHEAMRKIHHLEKAIEKYEIKIKMEKENELNCFSFRKSKRIYFRGWNNPSKSILEKFIIDENGRQFDNWETFFQETLKRFQ
jgi:hypothetical protein